VLPQYTPELHIGQLVDVYGKEQNKTHAIKAAEMRIYLSSPHDVSGVALIEETQPAGNGNSGTDKLIRADGYRIRITSKTEVKFVKPLGPGTEIGTNVWVEYKGSWNTDDVVVANQVWFYKNEISDGLKKQREHWEYDPIAVPGDSRQSGLDRGFRGNDVSRLPPHEDAAMELRVSAIGEKLVPTYQKGLAADDPTKINFRFYLVDAPKARDAFPLPSGIILMPYQVVARLQNDSQIAAILADKIACLIEEQPISLPLSDGQIAESFGLTGASFIPFVGLGVSGTLLAQGISEHKQLIRNREQRDRVTLSLMQDAGYNLLDAPKAWWLMSLKKHEDMSKSGPPENSVYMYTLLGDRLGAANIATP
jgi:hypothetical protein